jgi:2-iminobutanoate/2-iminopropanoate deaminase
MKKEVINIPGIAGPDSPFNHVLRAGETLYLTSQLSTDLKTGKIIKGDITEQTRRALENIKFLLESSGSSMDNIVKAVVYMRDVTEFDDMNEVYRNYFKKGQEPARVTIQAPSPIQGIDVEIEVTATLLAGMTEKRGSLRRVYPSSILFPLSFKGEGDIGGEVDYIGGRDCYVAALLAMTGEEELDSRIRGNDGLKVRINI